MNKTLNRFWTPESYLSIHPSYHYIMAKYLILILFFTSSYFAAASSSELEFQNSTIHFQAVKDKNKFQFSDSLGSRKLEIKNCNRSLVDKFWKDLVKNVNSLQSPKTPKERIPTSNAWVKYEGIQFRILDFEPSMKFFNNAPSNSHVLFAESKRLCRGK